MLGKEFDDLFFEDNLLYPDNFHDDFFFERMVEGRKHVEDLMMQMDSLKNRYFTDPSIIPNNDGSRQSTR
jgi:hypothetical protein